jgi:hypothetical protein
MNLLADLLQQLGLGCDHSSVKLGVFVGGGADGRKAGVEATTEDCHGVRAVVLEGDHAKADVAAFFDELGGLFVDRLRLDRLQKGVTLKMDGQELLHALLYAKGLRVV